MVDKTILESLIEDGKKELESELHRDVGGGSLRLALVVFSWQHYYLRRTITGHYSPKGH